MIIWITTRTEICKMKYYQCGTGRVVKSLRIQRFLVQVCESPSCLLNIIFNSFVCCYSRFFLPIWDVVFCYARLSSLA